MYINKLLIHTLLFIITFLSLTFREGIFAIFSIPQEQLKEIFFQELPYSLSLIIILFSHEMGHYLTARYYGIRATLPFFIPFPIGPIGTMGAVIQIQEPIPDKKKLFDVGVGGPFMSLILSIPCWIVGLYWSELKPMEPNMDVSHFLFFGDSLFTYWTAQLIHGPYNTAQFDIVIHPLAKAGWVGLVITAINLLPFGQLDGGHIVYSIFGEKYRNWIYFLFLSFIIFAFISLTWVIWSFLIYYLVKIEHPFVPDSALGLDKNRRTLGIFMMIVLIFIFVPVPMTMGEVTNRDNLFLEVWNWINR